MRGERILPSLILVLILLLRTPAVWAAAQASSDTARTATAAGRLSESRLSLLLNATRPERLHQLAGPLIRPRSVGSAGHEAVRAALSEFLAGQLGWTVAVDRFLADTPVGLRQFVNLVASPPASAKNSRASASSPTLVLAAHYDTAPVSPDFVGATDSAVSCAILLLLAEALKPTGTTGSGVDLRLVFFDGEEALSGRWTADDSLYGSRHLAARWSAKVSELVLLDLIGAGSPRFVYAEPTVGPPSLESRRRLADVERADFERLVAMETRLRSASLLPEATNSGEEELFFQLGERSPPAADSVDDDHAPFRRRGVATLHLVPTPFPTVWHTRRDTGDRVHWGHSAAVARVLLGWLAEKMA